MREPITKLAIVPISSMDSSIVKQLAPSLREFSINGGGNESPIIFFVARVIAKGEKNASERRILLVTLKHVILYDEQGRQVHAVHIVDLARVIVCQDGFTVLKVPREHDMAIKLDQSLYLEYFLNILKVLHLHFTIGSPIANDVPIDRRRPIDATSTAAGLLVQGSSTPCDQLTGGNKLNLTRNPNAQYVDHVTIPGILNVDTSKQDFLSLLLHIPPPPKRPAADAPLVTLSAQDMAKANAVLQHPLFRPVMEARAQQQQQQQHSASLTAPPSITSMQFDSTAPPSPMTRSVHTQPPPVPSHPVVEATPARVHNVTVRSIATIERDDDSPVISPRVEDRLIGGPTGWLKAAEPTPPAGVAPMPPPPPPPLSTSLGSSPLQKLMQVTPLPSVQAKALHASPITASTPSLLHDRVEGFMKLYMPQHLHLVERIASDYRGREEECLKMLFARLEHEQQHFAVPRKSSIFDDQSDVEVEAPYDAPRAHQPSHTTDDRQRQQQSFNNTSDFDSTGVILQRLQRLEEENRQLRDAVHNKQSSSIERQNYPSSSSHRERPRHYDAHHGQFQNTHESLHPHKQSKTLQRDAAYDHRDDEDHRQWDRHHARPEATVRPEPFARESQSRGSMEEFEASIGGRLPRDRVVLRQHRLDELRKDVHLLMSSDDSHSTRRGSGMQSVVRIGLLQDEIVATSAKQQLDVALTEEEDGDSGFSATRESLHPHSRPTMPVSRLSSRTPSEFTFPTQRSQGLDAFPKQSSHYAPNVAAAAAASTPSQSHGAGNATDDAGYAQWYYSEYVPRMMFQQRKAQQQGKGGQ
ncbi:Hypothetical protein, putative [Bodo saltans]|uniref:Uncharacterized protein n=1 Tax=Bodo saltans TaxID=75058 RepID=A0A0S4JT36_BODSA|nr:Hypothetical protein, putative [Bodo saltans]|eukprot:CUG92500.1 Hypothetical protein, putative [Bodo saltans]